MENASNYKTGVHYTVLKSGLTSNPIIREIKSVLHVLELYALHFHFLTFMLMLNTTDFHI